MSAFVDLCLPRPALPEAPHPSEHLIYRLKHWPRIPSASRTAEILRTLSVMSHRPVNRRWILNSSGLDAREVDMLLRRLIEQDAVQITDAGPYPSDPHAA
jgi:hypothetical protein